MNKSAGSNQSDLECQKQIAAVVVHVTAAGLGAVLKNYKTEADRTNFIRTFVTPIRFYSDQSGYFFVYNFDCLNIALPNPKEKEGQNLYNHQDAKGKYSIRELAAAAKKGGDFVEYYWLRPGAASKEQQKKIGYAEQIPGTNYFIGAGVYTGE